jgi:orotate phosphoribosyltransferase
VRGGISGWRVAIADDAVNAGTAVLACSRQLRDDGAIPVAVAALLSLGQAGTTMPAALSVPFYATETMQSQVWPTGNCPQCASETPLTNPTSRD